MATDASALLDILCAHETAVWEALVNGDQAADAAALDDSFLGVYPSGFAGKADHVGQLAAGPSISSYRLSACHVLVLTETLALLSYHADFIRAGATVPERMYVSSLWQQDGRGNWTNLFSQDTPAEPHC